jgi:hypothetical protein
LQGLYKKANFESSAKVIGVEAFLSESLSAMLILEAVEFSSDSESSFSLDRSDAMSVVCAFSEEPKSEKKVGLGESQDAKFFRGRTHLQKFTAPFSEKDDSSVNLKSFEEQPKSIADVHKPVSNCSDKKPPSTMFGQVFTLQCVRLVTISKVRQK